MVSALITLQFWQCLDAAVGALGDAACAECHVTHKTGLHSTRWRLDKVPPLKAGEGEKKPPPTLNTYIVVALQRCLVRAQLTLVL